MSNADPNIIANPKRIDALKSLLLLDTDSEEAFDRITRLAVVTIKSPVAIISLVDKDRDFFKSHCGLGEPWATLRQAPRGYSYCQHVVTNVAPLIIQDARFHPLTEGSPAIHELKAIAYMGIPLTLRNGHTIGSFCLIDEKPRLWSEQDITIATELAAIIMTEIELRVEVAQRVRAAPLINILEATSDLIVMVNMDNRVRGFNSAAREFFAITEDFDAHPRLDSFLTGETYEFLRNEAMRGAMENGSWAGDLYLPRHDGQMVAMSVIVLIHNDENDNHPIYWSFSAHNITALRETEQALQRSLEHEQRITDLQGRFINTIAHEFRNPLSAILSSLELLIRHGSRTDPTAHYARMKKSVRDISSILDHGLNLLEGNREEAPPTIGIIDLAEFAQAAATAAAPDKSRIIDVEAPGGTHVEVDTSALRLIADKLLSNAIKYSTTGTVVSLKLNVRDCDAMGRCQLVMHINDQGVGIPDEDQPFIFERFYRAYNQPNVPGLGTGLYQVKLLVERLKGKIEFYSHVGEGTKILILLPVMLTQQAAEPNTGTPSRQPSPSS